MRKRKEKEKINKANEKRGEGRYNEKKIMNRRRKIRQK